jgi:hypothetical protein
MLLLDMAHSWAEGTHLLYQSKIRFLHRFELAFDVQVLRSAPLAAPPVSAEIPLMWAQLSYSLQSGRRKTSDGTCMTLAYAIRQLRSAVSQYMAWDMMVRYPGNVYMDQGKRIIHQACRPTDSLGATLFASGLKARIGSESRPSVALLDRHVRCMDADLDRRYRAATTPAVRDELAKAGLANLSLWLGWLRSAENFELQCAQVSMVEPADGPSVDLPRGCGVVQYFMQPETKSSRSQTADVVIAAKTLSGYLGVSYWPLWLHRGVRANKGPEWSEDPSLVFSHSDGTPWTSQYFRIRLWKRSVLLATLFYGRLMAVLVTRFRKRCGPCFAISEALALMCLVAARRVLTIVGPRLIKSTSMVAGVTSDLGNRWM